MQFSIAEMATDIECARLMVYNAARLKDAGEPFTTEAAMAKLKVGVDVCVCHRERQSVCERVCVFRSPPCPIFIKYSIPHPTHLL